MCEPLFRCATSLAEINVTHATDSLTHSWFLKTSLFPISLWLDSNSIHFFVEIGSNIRSKILSEIQSAKQFDLFDPFKYLIQDLNRFDMSIVQLVKLVLPIFVLIFSLVFFDKEWYGFINFARKGISPKIAIYTLYCQLSQIVSMRLYQRV